jgi:dTDP-4-amino-4,6-dideoxygalactose transaminase
MQEMLDRKVSTRRGIMCSHREPAYADLPTLHSLRESERAQDQCILLPLYSEMTNEEQDGVINALKDACEAALPAV